MSTTEPVEQTDADADEQPVTEPVAAQTAPVRAEPSPKPSAAKDKKAKGKKPADKSKGKPKKEKAAADGGLSIATHPRAGAYVRRAKGWGGLAGFGIAAFLSLRAGVPADQAGLRAIAAGMAGYMLAWACAVTVWRHLVIAEMRTVIERHRRPAEPVAEKHGGGGDAEQAGS